MSDFKETNAIVARLTHVFNHACSTLPRPERTSEGANITYRLQTEFAYLINELEMGPKAMYQKNLADVRAFLDREFSEPQK